MKSYYSPKNNPRVIIIQKLYGKLLNEEEIIDFPKHRFKKFIKDIVNGTIERNDLLVDELDKNLKGWYAPKVELIIPSRSKPKKTKEQKKNTNKIRKKEMIENDIRFFFRRIENFIIKILDKLFKT